MKRLRWKRASRQHLECEWVNDEEAIYALSEQYGKHVVLRAELVGMLTDPSIGDLPEDKAFDVQKEVMDRIVLLHNALLKLPDDRLKALLEGAQVITDDEFKEWVEQIANF